MEVAVQRISPLQRPYPAPVQHAFDAIMPPGTPPLVLFTTMATSERAWSKFRAASLLDGRLLSLREREIVIDRTCARAGCEYEWGVHVAKFAKKARITATDVAELLVVPADAGHWTAAEAALIATVDALHERATLNDEEFGNLRTHYGDDQIFEIIMLAGFYRTVSYLANGLDLPLEPDGARFAEYGA